jgi:hypothetical protein
MSIEADFITEVKGYENVKWPTAVAYTPTVGEYVAPTQGQKPPLQISKVIHAKIWRDYEHVGYCGEVFPEKRWSPGLKIELVKPRKTK